MRLQLLRHIGGEVGNQFEKVCITINSQGQLGGLEGNGLLRILLFPQFLLPS